MLSLHEAILQFGPGKRNGRRVVFTNGCFDLLHPGHIETLEKARNLGDALIVGVNSDSSVRAMKGVGRPILPELERAEILAALECVDAVVIFDEPTPRETIAALLPDVRERFEALLRQPALEGVVSALQGGAKAAGCVGLTEIAKAIAVAYVTSQLRQPTFLVVDSNKKAEAIAETLRFCFSIFPGA